MISPFLLSRFSDCCLLPWIDFCTLFCFTTEQEVFMKTSKRWALALVILFLFNIEAQANPAGSGKGVPAMVADVFICRPLGLVALLGGSTLYVVTLPFTVPAGGTAQTKRTLIDYPYHYTFTRRLGEFYDDDI